MPAIVVAIVAVVIVPAVSCAVVVASGCVAIVVIVDRCRNSSIHPLEILRIPEVKIIYKRKTIMCCRRQHSSFSIHHSMGDPTSMRPVRAV